MICLTDTLAMLSILRMLMQLFVRMSVNILNVDDIEVDEDRRPEYAWCQLAPSTEHSNTNAAE